MLDTIKSVWKKWKVQISFVGGVLVIATAYGTCTLEPDVSEMINAAESESVDDER